MFTVEKEQELIRDVDNSIQYIYLYIEKDDTLGSSTLFSVYVFMYMYMYRWTYRQGETERLRGVTVNGMYICIQIERYRVAKLERRREMPYHLLSRACFGRLMDHPAILADVNHAPCAVHKDTDHSTFQNNKKKKKKRKNERKKKPQRETKYYKYSYTSELFYLKYISKRIYIFVLLYI